MSPNQPDTATEVDGKIEELTRMVQHLQQELTQLRSSSAPAPAPSVEAIDQVTGSRRQMLKLVGGAAAVGAVAATVGSSQHAAAATNDALIAGHYNYAANITYLGNGAAPNTTTATALTSEAVMFWADNRSSTLPNATGIRGDGRATGFGLWGNNDFGGVGVFGGSGAGIGVQASAGRAALYVTGANANPNTRTDAHNSGEIDIDSTGNLWFCVASGTPGTWRKLSGGGTAGAFHAISPARVYDSRWPGDSPINPNTNRTISVANGRTLQGVVNATNVVPAGATAIAYNLTVTATVGAGFLSVAAGTATDITSSAINWSSTGLDLANGLIVAVDASRQVKVFAGGGGGTHFIIDVNGYFL